MSTDVHPPRTDFDSALQPVADRQAEAGRATKYIFITGGVVSSLGKGIASASIGALLLDHGYSVRLCKLDPYLNVDPGTMSPYEHGEVFVTDDGAETDLDIGHYERFTNQNATRADNTTTGRIYQKLIEKERSGDHFLGKTVQVIPHVTQEIANFITQNREPHDFVIAEIGGTVGDIESLPFVEAIRQIGNDPNHQVMYVHLTLVPWLEAADELKTKPTQHSVKELRSLGIQPNLLLCRCSKQMPQSQCVKIANFCNVPVSNVFPAENVESIYLVPLLYRKHGVDARILAHFGLTLASAAPRPDDATQGNVAQGKATPHSAAAPYADLPDWRRLADRHLNPQNGEVVIGIVGKYTQLTDAYKSLFEAFTHAGIANDVKVRPLAIESDDYDEMQFAPCHAILVPGGFGVRGIEGKMRAAQYARENDVPYFGICYGMQLAVIEFARHVAGITDATSEEYQLDQSDAKGTRLVIRLQNWLRENNIDWQQSDTLQLGGTMRLGAFDCQFEPGSLIESIYGATHARERHRHRYEISRLHLTPLLEKGLRICASSFDGALPEAIEVAGHSWFIGVQYHPELKSRPFSPHPLFVSFVRAAMQRRDGTLS